MPHARPSVWLAAASALAVALGRPVTRHVATAATLEDISRAGSGDERVDVLARKCARIASCAHRHDSPLFREPGACVEYWLEHLEDTVEPIPACLASAASCVDVEACLHARGNERAAAICAAHPELSTTCDGDALITCAKDDPSESTLTACAPIHATCGEAHAAGGLVAHACLSTASCPADVTRARCDGTAAVVACHDQVEERIACRPGTACRAHVDEDGEELATCEGPAEVSCDTVGRRACRGSTLVRCEAHGHHGREASVDCGSLGLECSVVAGRAACRVPDETGHGQGEANATGCAASAPRCDGDAVVFCASGKTERIACHDLGLGPCEPEGRGPIALCGSGRARPERR